MHDNSDYTPSFLVSRFTLFMTHQAVNFCLLYGSYLVTWNIKQILFLTP